MFRRTTRALDDDREGRSGLTLAVLVLLLGLWFVWFCWFDLTVYEVSSRARVEVSSAVQPLEAPVSGRVIATPMLQLGRLVEKGDVIVELDSESQRLSLAQSTAKLEAIQLEIDALTAERAVQVSAVDLEKQHGTFAVSEAQGNRRVAEVKARQARLEEARASKLLASGIVSKAEAQRLMYEARGLAAVNAVAGTQARKAINESARSEVALASQIAAIDRTLSSRRGDLLVEEAQTQMLRHEIVQRLIRANSSGRISEVSSIHVGSFVTAGTRLATVLAPDDLRVVADFEPSSALGRLNEGQVARVHLSGFPSVEYGHLPATVRRVATELRDGLVRVELDVDPSQTRVPLQHGLPASVSVEIEHATAAKLTLRAVGMLLAPKPQAGPTQ